MIRQIKSLYDKTLARIVPPAGADGKELDAAALVRRRVEITVERETVSVLMPGQPAERTVGTAECVGETADRPSVGTAQRLLSTKLGKNGPEPSGSAGLPE